MQAIRLFALVILSSLLIPSTYGQYPASDHLSDLDVAKIDWTEDEDITLRHRAFHASMRDSDVEIGVYVTDSLTGVPVLMEMRTISNEKWHHFNIGSLSLGNRSMSTFTIVVESRYEDGFLKQDQFFIRVKKRPDWYSSSFSSDGRHLYFYSHDNFTVRFVYTYSIHGSNETVFRNISGKRDFRIPKYRGLTSMDVFITDRWGNVNHREGVTEWGDPKPIHFYYYDERISIWEMLGRVIGILAVLSVATALIYALSVRSRRG